MVNFGFIKKFRFKSFDDNAYEEIVAINYEDYCKNKIIKVFFIDSSKILAVLFLRNFLEMIQYIENIEGGNNIDDVESPISFKFYNQNLKSLPYLKVELRSPLIMELMYSIIYIEYSDELGEDFKLFYKSWYISVL